MPLSLSRLEQELKEDPIRQIAHLIEAAKAKKDFISFGGGAPSLEPPKAVTQAIIAALKKNPKAALEYTTTQGNLSLRERIASDLKRSDGVSISPEQIALTVGASEAIALVAQDVINPGDEVILADPTYVGYLGPSLMAHARAKYIPTTWQNNFQLPIEALKKEISKKTKAIFLLTPDNPTGRVLSKENTKAIADLAVDNDLWVISDETYKDILYEGKHWPIYKFAPENTISVCSFSKSASSPGLRLGYVYGPEEAIDGLTKLNQYAILCPPSLSQIAAEAFYDVKRQYLKKIVLPTYKKRMLAMGKALKEHLPLAGFVQPQAAFYYFVDFTLYLLHERYNDKTFAKEILRRKKVVLIPGSYFGSSGKNHCRLTFVSEPESRIREGVERIADFFS